MVTFALTVSLHAEDYKKTVLEVTANVEKMEVSKTTTLVDGEPCGEICAEICGPFSPRVFDCMYTYCDSGNGGGTFACKRGEDPMNPVPPDKTKVGTINP